MDIEEKQIRRLKHHFGKYYDNSKIWNIQKELIECFQISQSIKDYRRFYKVMFLTLKMFEDCKPEAHLAFSLLLDQYRRKGKDAHIYITKTKAKQSGFKDVLHLADFIEVDNPHHKSGHPMVLYILPQLKAYKQSENFKIKIELRKELNLKDVTEEKKQRIGAKRL